MNFETPLALFQHLLGLDEQSMAENLPALIDDNHEFYEDVIALITAHQENQKQTSFNVLISKQAEQLVEDNEIHELVGRQIGVYKLVKKLGQGGMGAVYLGERNDGQLEQKVAIKFVYPSIAALTGDNFLHKEAQHLANLEHANIAKIFTVDTNEENLPYMVMEYVDGTPIDDYCESNNLNLNERLKLFQKVCDAVNTAHQNMLIHADIKPSNILVDNQGEPKLMDFGIARRLKLVINEDEKNSYLKAMSRKYASPEQIDGKHINTTSDIFSLGKLLLSLTEQGYIDCELHSIANKASLAENNERYQSAIELATKIELYRNGYAIPEYSKGLLYRFKKLLKRNQLVSSLLVVIGLIITSSAYSSYHKNQELIEQLEISQNVTNFMTNLFELSNIDQNSAYSVNELLEKGVQELNSKNFHSHKAKAHLLAAIAKSYHGQGLYKQAEPLYLQALDSFNSTIDESFIKVQNELAELYMLTDRVHEAQQLLNSILSTFSSFEHNEKYKTVDLIGLSLQHQGKYSESRDYHVRALNWFKKSADKDLFMESTINGNIGVSYMMEGLNEEALPFFERAITLDSLIYAENVQKPNPRVALHFQQYGAILGEIGQFQKGLVYLKKALKMFESIYSTGHPRLYAVLNNVATIYGRDLQQPKQALEYLHQSVKSFNGGTLNDSIDLAVIYHNIATNYRDLMQYSEAVIWHEKALKIMEKIGERSFAKGMLVAGYGETLINTQYKKRAMNNIEIAIEILKEVSPEHDKIAQLESLRSRLN